MKRYAWITWNWLTSENGKTTAAYWLILALAAAWVSIGSIGCGVTLPPCLVAGTCLPVPPVASPTPAPTAKPPNDPGPGPSTPPPTCPPGQVLVPTNMGTICTTPPVICPAILDDDASPVSQLQSYGSEFDVAVNRVRGAHPTWFVDEAQGWRVPGAGDGGHNNPTPQAVTDARVALYRAFTDSFFGMGLCAQLLGGGKDQGDELHVFAPGAVQSYRYKLIEYGGGRERKPHYAGSSKIIYLGAPATPPPATPPPTAPTPAPPVATPPPASCPSLGRIVLAVRQQARLLVDATPQTSDRSWCDANGFAGRLNCPMGNEGTANRPLCETAAGPYVWSVAGGEFFNNDNPLQIVVTSHPPGASVRVCGANGTCSDPAVLP